MEFNPDDFKKLQYNVMALPPDKNVMEEWPELERYPEFVGQKAIGISRDKVLRYIILCYDKKSPLLSEKNLLLRKRKAAELAGFEKSARGHFEDRVMDIINNENKLVSRMIIRYVRIQGDMRYSLLVSGLETYYENIAKISYNGKDEDVLDSAEKSKLFEQSKKMSDDLERLSDELFNGDMELMEEADEVFQEENNKITSYPEWWAKQKAEKRELEKQADIGS